MLLALRLLGRGNPRRYPRRLAGRVAERGRHELFWQRTTPLAAALLDCAARGQAAAEVAAVLHCVAGEKQVEPAARKLLAAEGHGPGSAAPTSRGAW